MDNATLLQSGSENISLKLMPTNQNTAARILTEIRSVTLIVSNIRNMAVSMDTSRNIYMLDYIIIYIICELCLCSLLSYLLLLFWGFCVYLSLFLVLFVLCVVFVLLAAIISTSVEIILIILVAFCNFCVFAKMSTCTAVF